MNKVAKHQKPKIKPAPRPVTLKRVRKPTGDTTLRGKVRVNRGGLRKDGTPMPPTHDEFGHVLPGVALKGHGRPKGSFSLDRIIRNELQKLYGTERGEAYTKADAIMRKLVDQAISSPQRRGNIARFLTERVDGKAVQPIKDVTPGLRLSHVSDEQLRSLLDGAAPKIDAVPAKNRDLKTKPKE